jgi:chromate transport protein ChrA
MITVLGFFAAWFVGCVASFVLLLAFENEHPKCQDIQLEKQINQAMKKLIFRAGLITALAWLVLYHWRNYSN